MSNGITNKLICGDNLEELSKLLKESVDLIYIDPPFFSNRNYEVIWGDEAEIRSFKDRWEGGIEHYIGWLEPRVQLLWGVLKPTGSFYLHCDWHANAHIRIMLDKIFELSNFKNEIVWNYESGGRSINFFPRKHDTIFYYTKSKTYTFNGDDISVRRDICLECGNKLERWNNLKRNIDKDGRVYRTIKSNDKIYKYYDDDPVIPPDVWLGINHLQQKDPERLGYPTQKPPKLLERIIKASSNKDDLVLDAFCGCGTALTVSQNLKRHWIGIDISPTAIKVIERKLKIHNVEKGKDYVVIGEPTTIRQLEKLEPFEFQNWIIDTMRAKHSKRKVGDMGLDGYIDKDLYHEAAGIQVKQSESIGRNVVDNFKAALDRAKYKKGYIVAFSFGSGAHEETARLKNEGSVNIELVTVEDLLYKKVTLK